MPHYENCIKCERKYFEKHSKYPDDDRFKAVYRKEIEESNENAHKLGKRLTNYWYQTKGTTAKFKACATCYRNDPEIANLMEHVSSGWMVMSKEEYIVKDLQKNCVVM